MTFKERLNLLREKVKGLIKPETTPEEIAEHNQTLAEIDALETEFNNTQSDIAKFKDTIVNMVMREGDGNAPRDESEVSNPKSIEEFVADFEKAHEERS